VSAEAPAEHRSQAPRAAVMGGRFDFFAVAAELERRGEPFATATVVRIERPTSGKPGDRAIVTLDGELRGWIGGSCARPTVVEEALAALRDGRSRLVRLATEPDATGTREGITDLSMTCFSGGTMEIFIEPNPPRPRLLIAGDQPLARALAELAAAMGYQVAGVGAELPGAGETLAGPEAIAAHAHPLTAIVVATHGDHDEIALEHAFESAAPYVGLVASRKRAESIRKYLAVRGIAEERLAALHAPAGLDIGAREPREIALAILAEIVQVLRASDSFDWGAATDGAEREAEGDAAAAGPPETALDPVCGMTVRVVGAAHVHDHEGVRYYFCCGGCLAKFAAEPESFLAAG
jgi:xanthine dehydrogenase accessory factor